ncbi:cell filamentation protein Fic [Candidatus Peregrinibacteria bacterium RIFCSPLOWO2_01_FULL_39_12]|nr:MAG: cell filamentation protein Fic [Candidatus Peregrinibacteria bacterium RIFCSPLOWO2_02_FULL_39_10]OGJ42235.1 MAG: cell filamentation protein Fic [Candidatus Peregrinibacteria bacterium RIFCSPLOWO2_01_FULL_39_12]
MTKAQYLSKNTVQTLESKLKELKSLRPISPTILNKIREQFQIEMAYNSNAIEGNSLTLKETFWVIQEGLTIKEKPLKDHLEAKNHKEALEFLYELTDSKKQNTVSEHLIRELHHLVVQDSQRDIAGKYRDGDVYISGADHKPPSHIEVPIKMGELMKWLNDNKNKYHIVELVALLHHKMVNIHPFWDGNGRVSRLVMNILILNAGYPLAVILKNDRKRYYRVLSLADKGEYKPICEFVAQAVIRSLNIYLRVLNPTTSKNKQLISLEELSKNSPYSAAYLRKLATQGKVEATKDGRNWLSTKESLKNYIDSLK